MKSHLLKKALFFNVLFLIFVQSCVIAQPERNDSSEEETVCITRTGDKYHRCSCHYLSKSSINIKLSDAHERYLACSVCKPPRYSKQTKTRRTIEVEVETEDNNDADAESSGDDTEVSTPTKKSTTPASGASRQCTAIAKSTGQRCTRKTTNASGKCFQHDK